MRRISTRATLGTAVLISAVFIAGLAAAITMDPERQEAADGTTLLVTAGATGNPGPTDTVPSLLSEASSTTAPTPTAPAVPPAFIPPPSSPPAPVVTTVVTAPLSTTSTTVRVTTTTPGTIPSAGRSVSLTPTSGTRRTEILVRGTGCLTAGSETSVGLAIHNPAGELIDGDGSLARPDGTWQIPIYISRDPGVYTVRATCRLGSQGNTPMSSTSR